jgi:hypothetical protein
MELVIEECPVCGHPLDPHELVPDIHIIIAEHDGSKRLVPLGGTFICPADGCDCVATWSLCEQTRELIIRKPTP